MDDIQTLTGEVERLTKAVRYYASYEALHLKSRMEIQNDLLAIAGEPHIHRRSVGSDMCDLCLHDLRHEIHHRKI